MRVRLASGGYDVVVGDALLPRLPDLLRRHCPAAAYAVVTDTHVAPLVATPLRDALDADGSCGLLVVPAGEWNKTRETWATVTDGLLASHVGRDGAVIAVGGGVVGDLAGFAAATYLRGIRWVQVPTTLLAMVDASIGGKTGLDTPEGKNLLGAFHQPAAVFADVSTLRTLPPIQLAAGAAEAIKHGVIADAEYLTQLRERREDLLRGEAAACVAAVTRSVEIKAAVVAEDERDVGRRATLNFGHTVAHALEAVTGYELLHGEAVAIGMRVEAELGERIGVTDPGLPVELRATLEAFDLPVEIPDEAPTPALVEAMRRDKKRRSRTVRFALPARPGEMAQAGPDEWTVAVEESVIADVLARCR